MGREASAWSARSGRDVEAQAPSYEQVVRACGRVAAAAGAGVETLIGRVAGEARQLLGVERCSLYLRDAEREGIFHGRIADTAAGRDERVGRLVCGSDADGFTRELLATRGPVLIADAPRDLRPVRAAVRTWDVRAILGVPMVARDTVVGLLFLDDPGRRHAFREHDAELAQAFADLVGATLDQALERQALRAAAEQAQGRVEALRRRRLLEERATSLALRAATIQEVAEALNGAIGRPTFFHDRNLRLRAAAGVEEAGAAVRSPLAAEVRPALRQSIRDAAGEAAPVIVGPFAEDGFHHRFLVAPIVSLGTQGGYVVVPELGRPFAALDASVVRRIASIVGLAYAARRHAAEIEAHARRVLVRDLLRGLGDDAELRERAIKHGMERDRRRAVVVLRHRDERAPDLSRERVEAALGAAGLHVKPFVEATGGGEVSLIVPHMRGLTRREGSARLRERIERLVELLSGEHETVGAISLPCETPAGCALAFEEARQVLRSVLTVGASGQRRVLTCDELGVGRLLLAGLGREEAERFALQTLGPLLEPDESANRSEELVRTLAVFFDHCRSVRRTAAQLAVHENTIRYRLARTRELIGLDIAGDPDDQLSVQLALVVLRLQGRLPEAGCDALAEPPAAAPLPVAV